MLKCSNVKMNRGFTLIEVLAAIVVITIGLVGVLTIIQQTISYMALSSSRLVASYLAQEGIEIVRNIRDGNWLEGADWNVGLAEGTYGVDYLTQTLPDLNCSSDGYLRFENNFYRCSTNPDTKFKRKIIIVQDTDGGNPRLKVLVQVEWQQIGKSHRVEAQEYLYNWR